VPYLLLQALADEDHCSVPPAELESVLLQNPEVADSAVIGVQSVEQATELPRLALSSLYFLLLALTVTLIAGAT
jgi:hypothetical protein